MQLRAHSITPAAKTLLEGAGSLRPLHVFEQVCNLIDEAGRVLSVQTDGIPPGPVSLVVPAAGLLAAGEEGFRGWLTVEEAVRVRSNQLLLAGRRIEWTGARVWDPKPPWQQLRETRRHRRRHLVALADQLQREGPAGGLASLAPSSGRPSERAVAAGTFDEWVVAAAAPAILRLGKALGRWDDRLAREAAADLAGLGGGLTPSGDDFLVGIMHGLWTTLPAGEAATQSRVLAEASAPRTNLLSASLLRAAARGETSGSWHRLFDALLRGEWQALETAASQLLRVGHTSGADSLAGFIWRMRDS